MANWKSALKAAAQGTASAAKKTASMATGAIEQRRQAKQASEPGLVEIEPSAKTLYDSVTSGLIQIIGLVAPLLIAVVLTVGNGYFFSGFHMFTWADMLTVWAYTGGGVLEAIGLGLVYRAARRYRKGDYKGMMFTFVWLLLLMAGSIFAQYMFLQGLYVDGTLQVPDTAAEHAPLFSWLVGIGSMRGHDIVFFVRAILFHVGELACSFVVVDKAKTITQILADRREIHDAEMAMERQKLQLEREREEAAQDAQIKRLQHQWLLQQVRQGVVFVNAEPTQDKLPQPNGYQDLLPAGDEQDEMMPPKSNGHTAFHNGQTN